MDNKMRYKFHQDFISNVIKINEVYEWPKSLIKFCNGSYSSEKNNYLDALEKDMLWMSSPICFNDPFDCAININYEKIKFEQYSKTTHLLFEEKAAEEFLNRTDVKSLFNKLVKLHKFNFMENAKNFCNNVFVSCFSEISNLSSLRMWSHYANSHKGFCLEYDFFEILKNISQGQHILPIFYSKNYNFDYLRIRKSNIELRKFLLDFAFTKSNEWEYEKEWRLFSINESHASKTGYLITFIRPKKIYLGCKAENKLKEQLISICKKRKLSYIKYIWK